MNRPLAPLWFAALLFGVGCAAPKNEMVIGIYDAPRDALPRLSSSGFNLVTMAGSETNTLKFLDSASAEDIGVILSPELDTPAGRRRTARLDRHPALSAWYLMDEPDLHFIAPQKLHARKRELRRVASKPALVVLASGSAVERFRDVPDLLAVDWYPIPWAPLATISREMRTARLAAGEKGFLAIVQAFDWTAYSDLLVGPKEGLRPPTYDEMRCMSFITLFQGARGLLYYTFHAGAWKIREHPEVWDALRNIVAELRQRAPVFNERVKWWPDQTRYDDEAGMYNEIKEGKMLVNLFRVRNGTEQVGRGYYFVAINTTAEPVSFSFRLPFENLYNIETYCAPGATAVRDGWLRKEYQPYEVCFFGPIEGNLVLNRLP